MSLTDRFVDWWCSLAPPQPGLSELLPPPPAEPHDPNPDAPFKWEPFNDGSLWGAWSITVKGRTARGCEANEAAAHRKAMFFLDRAMRDEVEATVEYM